MKSRFIALIALGLACVLAAGGGAYLAVRQGQHEAQAAPAVSQPTAPVQQSASQGQGTPVALVTTPAAPGEAVTPPAAATATPVQESNRGSNDVARQATKPPRRVRTHAEAVSPEADRGPAPSGQQSPAPSSPSTAAPAAVDPPPPPVAPPPQSVNEAPPEPQREWVEVSVPAETVLGLQIQTAISSETARVEDRVDARITRDVRVGDRVAIPAGSEALGTVTQVDRGGKLKDRAHFAVRFDTLLLPDGTRLPLTAEAVHREGPSPANKSAARIGGATVGGAILGAILGGGKGAAIGGAIGAGGGTAATMASDREPATLPAGSIVNIRLMSPVSITLER